MTKMIPRLKASIPLVTMAIIGYLCVSCTPTPSEISRALGGDDDVPPVLTLTPGSDASGEKRSSDAANQAVAYLVRTRRLNPAEILIFDDYVYTSLILNQDFQIVTTHENRVNGHTYYVFINLDNGQIFDGALRFKKAEWKAEDERYGKLDPELHEHLQGLENDDMVPVILWVSGKSQSYLEKERFNILSEKYPEVREARERGSLPWDVKDPILAEKIYNEYIQMGRDEIETRLAPLVAELIDKGFDPKSLGSAPTIYVRLTKQEIISLSRRDDINTIYLNEPRELIQW